MTERLDDQIDRLFMLRERQRGLEAQIKEIKDEYNALHDEILARCDEIGTETARGGLASVTITETVVPTIDDWGAVSEWVMENDGVYLLHRRVSSGPWKELLDAGVQVPGIVPYTKRAISLRKRRD